MSDDVFFVQVKYGTAVSGMSRDGWVTVAATDERLVAAKHAAHVYRKQRHPDDDLPEQVRVVHERQLRGERAVDDAYESLRTFAETLVRAA